MLAGEREGGGIGEGGTASGPRGGAAAAPAHLSPKVLVESLDPVGNGLGNPWVEQAREHLILQQGKARQGRGGEVNPIRALLESQGDAGANKP